MLDADFTFQNKNNKLIFEIEHAPWAYIDNLSTNIEIMLNILERYGNILLENVNIKKCEKTF